MHERGRCGQAFREGLGKLEGPATTGWHKVGLLFTFLLVACLRLSLILINPMHKSHHVIHHQFLDSLTYIYLFGYNYLYATFINAVDFIFYHLFVYLPIWLRYRWKRLKLLYRWGRLSWQWWLILFCGHWNEPERRPGKINGTYWMHIHEDLYAISGNLKALNRRSRKLDAKMNSAYEYSAEISEALHFLSMIWLTGIGICYFMARIILYKLNPSSFKHRLKRPWSKQCKQKRTYQVHNIVLNLDDKIQRETVSFDTDSSHIICDNSAT